MSDSTSLRLAGRHLPRLWACVPHLLWVCVPHLLWVCVAHLHHRNSICTCQISEDHTGEAINPCCCWCGCSAIADGLMAVLTGCWHLWTLLLVTCEALIVLLMSLALVVSALSMF